MAAFNLRMGLAFKAMLEILFVFWGAVVWRRILSALLNLCFIDVSGETVSLRLVSVLCAPAVVDWRMSSPVGRIE